MIRTACVRPEPAASGVFVMPASRAPHASHGSRGGAQLAVRTPESAPCPGAGEGFRQAGGRAVPGLDYALSFIPAVTEAVEGASADPGTLLPGTR